MNTQQFTTSTFSLSIPAVYTDIQVAWESIRAAHEQPGDDYLSFASTTLLPIVYFDEFTGADLASRYWPSCLQGDTEIEIIADKTLPLADLVSNVRLLKSDDKIFYYLGIVQINNEYCYTFRGDCKIEQREFYEPLFEEIWQSLTYFGDPKAAMDKLPPFLKAIYYNEECPVPIVKEKDVPQREQIDTLKEIEPFSIPADGKEFWIIDGIELRFLPDEYSQSVNGRLYIGLKGIIPEFDMQRHGHVINSYNGGASFTFGFSKVYHKGIPTGIIPIVESQDQTYDNSIWAVGFQYSLAFTGNITLQDGWLGLNGYMEDKWNPKSYKISLAKKIPMDDIEWDKYEFTTFLELETAAPKTVRQLKLTNPDYIEFRESVYPLTHLETLIIDFSNNSKEAAEFVEIPTFIKHFKNLKKLYFSGISSITKFPKWIGDLKELEFLLFTDSKIKGIYPSVFQYLSKLKFCYLQYNCLVVAPDFRSDSMLEILHLEGNQLNKLPASLLKLKNLGRLNIIKNPISWLPVGLENIPELELELDKKTTLLDYTYKGADGKGTVSYNDELFFARNDIALSNTLTHAIEKADFKKYENGINMIARHSVGFATTVTDPYDEKGNHRFGGLPDLPANMDYPTVITKHGETNRGWQFIAQINCESIAHLQDYLPRKGMLYFFIEDQQDFVPKVIYYEGGTSDLKSAKELTITEDFIYDELGLFEPYKAESEKYVSTPVFYYDEHYYEHIAPELKELTRKHNETEAFKTMLLPFDNDKSLHSINSYVFKQHGSPELEAVDKLKGKSEEWMVLLKVSSDNNPEFCFWDAGEIYFVIHKSDLAKGDFSNVYCGLETS